MKRSGTRCILQSHGPMSKCNICTFSPAEQNITRLVTVSLKITDKPTAGGLGSDRINNLWGGGGGWLITAPSQWSVYLSECLSGRVWAAQNRQLLPIRPPGGSTFRSKPLSGFPSYCSVTQLEGGTQHHWEHARRDGETLCACEVRTSTRDFPFSFSTEKHHQGQRERGSNMSLQLFRCAAESHKSQIQTPSLPLTRSPLKTHQYDAAERETRTNCGEINHMRKSQLGPLAT